MATVNVDDIDVGLKKLSVNDADDKETELQCLLRENKSEIDALRELCKDVLPEVVPPSTDFDDVWLLRYILSNKTAKESEESLRFMIQWRKDHKEDLDKIARGEYMEGREKIEQFQVAGPHKYTSAGDQMIFVRIGLCNTKGLMDNVPFEDVLRVFEVGKEETFRYCDKATREKGRLVKSITVLDFSGFSITAGNDKRFSKVLGDSSKVSEKCYPQLLGRSIMINTPSIFGWLFGLMKPLMSKRALEKVVFCPGNGAGAITNCPYVSRVLPLEDVPTFLGGKCNCPGGCIGGIPNSQTTPVSAVSDDGVRTINIARRSEQVLEIPVGKNAVVDGSFEVEARKLYIAAELKTPDGSSVTLLEHQKLESENGALNTTWNIPENGLLVVKMDNLHSMLRGKTIKYKITVDESKVDMK